MELQSRQLLEDHNSAKKPGLLRCTTASSWWKMLACCIYRSTRGPQLGQGISTLKYPPPSCLWTCFRYNPTGQRKLSQGISTSWCPSVISGFRGKPVNYQNEERTKVMRATEELTRLRRQRKRHKRTRTIIAILFIPVCLNLCVCVGVFRSFRDR